MPTPEQAPPPALKVFPNFQTPSTISSSAPYFVFIPVHDPWHGPLFGRLAVTSDTVPIIQGSNGKWGLREDTRESWSALEQILGRVCSAMRDICTFPIPICVRAGIPYQAGYSYTKYHTLGQARRAVIKSRDGFLPLLGHISMYFFVFKYNEDKPGCDNWRHKVCAMAGVHSDWFRELEHSVVADFTVPRIGGILDLSSPPAMANPTGGKRTDLDYLVGVILKTNLPIPLYVRWGKFEDALNIRRPKSLEEVHFILDYHEMNYLQALPGVVKFSPWSQANQQATIPNFLSSRDTHPFVLERTTSADVQESVHPPASSTPSSSTPSSSTPSSSFPPVERYSGQRAGETMSEFFARRARTNEATLAKETPQARSQRLQRETHAQRGGVPGKKGACVFVWEKVNEHYIRRSAGRQNYEDVWEEYSSSQRVYDAFRNEWDVCEAFGHPDPDDNFSETHGGGGDDDDDGEDYGVPWEEVKDDKQPLPPQISEADLDRIHDPLPLINNAPQPTVFTQTAAEVASFRFGCMMPTAKVRPEGLNLPHDKLTCKIMGDKDITLPGNAQAHNLKSFLVLAQTGMTLRNIDSALLDFHYPGSRINQVWVVDVKRVMCPKRSGFEGGLRYVVQDTDSPGPFFIVLDNAASVLEIMRRRWGPSISDIALELLRRGVTFHLCTLSEHLQQSGINAGPTTSLKSYSGMGYCSKDFKPDMRDYQGYLDFRQRFLQTPRGRVALRSGGIIARIARDALAIEDGILGPGDEVLTNGLCFWDGRTPRALWDDQLTADEIDVVCGVYHIATGAFPCLCYLTYTDRVNIGQRDPNSAQGRQVTTRSWWPRPTAFFRNSALDVGWWTPACEYFYLNRVKMYNDGILKLETAAAWKDNLKLDRKVLPYIHAIERLSAEILATLRP
ncbi:hypothetical protein R3P38DRAFT_2496075 [Favolaschia claudopus]|uniref:Uncharacterized protein n=1 Tax=Favolaschia claudopus TaxID=2862362 RepID=A0AAW0E256_9AGAR